MYTTENSLEYHSAYYTNGVDAPISLWFTPTQEKIFTNQEDLGSKEDFDSFDNYLRFLAKDVPSIEVVRESTRNLPSFSKLISEERENE